MLAPDVQHKYPDLAYQLPGEIVTRVSGIRYPRYVRDLILDPPGMSATGSGPPGGPLPSRRAAGYSRRPFPDELDLEPAFPPVRAEGGPWSCIRDLARWISFQLRACTGPAADSPVLAAASGEHSVHLAPDCPARGHRLNGDPPGRRTRSATPTIDPATSHMGPGAYEEDGGDQHDTYGQAAQCSMPGYPARITLERMTHPAAQPADIHPDEPEHRARIRRFAG